jgi:nucleoside 2-deoxyribosyltransferase
MNDLPFKVYLAAKYDLRDEMREHRERLKEVGIEVTSRWLDEQGSLDGNMDDKDEEFYSATARVDLEDVLAATFIIFFAEDPRVGVPRGGRHVEFGYALALNKPIAVIGPRENIFHHLTYAGIRHFTSLEAFIKEFKKNVLGE